MDAPVIGLLHPGAMGTSIGVAARTGSSRDVVWASEGRSTATRDRARDHGLIAVDHVADVCSRADVIVCVCPPEAAIGVATEVAQAGFGGTYLDANAVSPATVRSIEEMLAPGGARVVDGSIIGPPAWEPGTTTLYLSGQTGEELAPVFTGGALGVEVLGDQVGAASALKMCNGAFTKGTTGLVAVVLAAAERLEIRDQLIDAWRRAGDEHALAAASRVAGMSRKAWRFAGEMDDAARTLRDAGVDDAYAGSAAEVFRALAGFKGSGPPDLEAVLRALVVDERSADLPDA